MNIGIDPYFPWFLTLLAVVLAIFLFGLTLYRYWGLVAPRFLGKLAALRLVALAAVVFLVLNPYVEKSEPDPDNFRVVLLGDASGSMETADLADGQMTRAEVLERWIRNRPDSPLQPLRNKNYFLEPRIFSETARPLPFGDSLQALPGLTAIGDVLHSELDRPEGELPELGAVLLLSDGHSNYGASPMEAARRYRDRGIPISTVGIGHPEDSGRFEIGFRRPRQTITRGESTQLVATLRNQTDREQTTEVTLSDEDEEIFRETITLAAGEEEEISERVTPWRSPFQVYRLEANFPEEPERRTEVDYSVVELQDRDTFRILYLGGTLSMEYRFLRRAIRQAESLSIEAVIQTGEQTFFQALEESLADYENSTQNSDTPSPLPTDPSFFFNYDTLLVDTRILFDLPEETLEALVSFADQRGGGLLFTGPLESVPSPLERILPIRSTERGISPRRYRLDIEPAPVFTEIDGSVLFRSPYPFVPEEKTVNWSTEWKRGARPIIKERDGERALLLAQAYGAGRVAFMGSESTWRWRMESDTGFRQHQQFWENLLTWLSSQGKPRIQVPAHGQRFSLNEPMEMAIEILGSDFRPAREGDVRVTVESPDGDSDIYTLTPSFARPGRFSAPFTPQEFGEHRLRFRIDLPDGEQLDEEAWFLATPTGREMDDVTYREDVLRDLARLTGGEFYVGEDFRRVEDLPVSERIPVRVEPHFLAHNFILFLFLFLPMLYEWYLRRSHGLK
ncbi:MAG: VWA domain-containing protein [Opitutales bacterium]|nr:VWA domain-containing protein [Opitutales bacterium]MCH8539551.1 VWA domain-containing protein [Opitutales bacterium]